MIASPSQRWSSSVHDLFACARGRLPASFLERKLADLGLTGVAPLPYADLQRLEKAVDLVNELCAGRPAPRGLKPDAALQEAFPDEHATLGKLRPVAQAYITSMRPAKPDKARRPAEGAATSAMPAAAPERREERRDDRRDDRRPERRDDRRDDRRERPAPQPEAPRAVRVTWEQWLEGIFPPAAPAVPATPTDVVAATPSEAPAAEAAPAPVAPVAPAIAPFVPPALVHWQIDSEAKRQLGRIRERATDTVAAKAEPAAALRELAFAILRPPMAVRDDLRALLAEFLQRNGVTVTLAALYPPPAVAAMKRDWENLLAQRGPADPSVETAWRKLLEAHPEAKAKLEAERAQELDDLVRRFAVAVREIGEEDPRTREIRTWMESRHAGAAERITAELAAIHAAITAAATAGRLIHERNWEDAEVLAALQALDPAARQRLDSQRRKEFDELDRRLRTVSREQGPDGEATRAALTALGARFPSEGAAATARLDRVRRGEGLVQQERERREAGKPVSSVQPSATEHRLVKLAAAPRWRLVIAVAGPRNAQTQPAKEGKDGREPRARRGHAIGWLISEPCATGPVATGWRAADCGSLDELDAAVQAVVDRAGGLIGLPLADCPEHGDGMWADAAYALATLAALVVPVDGACEIAVELPAWAEVGDAAALDAALLALGTVTSTTGAVRTITRIAPAADNAASLAEAVAWSWDGRKEADAARIRQAALASGILLQPSTVLREALAQLATGALPAWPAWSTLLADATEAPDGIAAALLQRIQALVAASSEAVIGLHRHLTGLARGKISDPARLVRELAWLEGLSAGLRPRDRLRLDLAVVAAQAAAGRLEATAAERLSTRLSDLRDDWPAEVLEAALHAAAYAREALDPEAAEAFVAPWGRGDAAACGGRALLAKLCEERARIAASAGRWKDARKHLERGVEVATRCADHADRDAILARLAVLRAAVLSDDATVSDEEARAAVIAVLSSAEPIAAAIRLAVEGTPRSAHLALLRWAIRRQDEDVISAYLGRRTTWCDPREATGAILALRAIVLAPVDANAARALLVDACERAGGEVAPAALRLSMLACAVAAALKGAALPDLKDRLAALRRERPAANPAVEALERALALAPDAAAGLAEALPLLVR